MAMKYMGLAKPPGGRVAPIFADDGSDEATTVVIQQARLEWWAGKLKRIGSLIDSPEDALDICDEIKRRIRGEER